MNLLKIFFRVQLVILALFAVYVFHSYQSREPVTRMLVDSTWKLTSYKIGLCSESCFQNWTEENQKSPETHLATQKMVRWVVQFPSLTQYVISRMSEEQRGQLRMLTTLSQTTPESAALFESTYGIKPATLQSFLER